MAQERDKRRVVVNFAMNIGILGHTRNLLADEEIFTSQEIL